MLGDEAVDYIEGPPEPSGSNVVKRPVENKTQKRKSIALFDIDFFVLCAHIMCHFVISGGKTTYYKEAEPSESSMSIKRKCTLGVLEENQNQQSKKIKIDGNENWQKSVIDLEKMKFEAEQKHLSLKCYNLTLRNLSLEKQLQLTADTVNTIRLSIAPELLEQPVFDSSSSVVENDL